MTTTAPTVTTPAAAAPAAPAVKPPIGKASDHLAALATQEKAGMVGTGQADKLAQPETPGVKPELTKEEKEAERRLSLLATERRKFEEEKKAHAATVAETARKAALWDKLEEAKTAGKAMGVLRQLWDEKEIDGKVYNELAADVLARTPGNEPLSPAQVQDMVDARIAAEKEAATKAAETEKATKATKARQNYLAGVNKHFDAVKYPLVEEFKIQPEELCSTKRNEAGEVVDPGFVDTFFAEHDELPTPEQIFSHFEGKHRARIDKATKKGDGTPAPGVPQMVTSKDTASTETDAVDYKSMTLKQRWEWAKRQNDIRPGA